MLHTDRTSFAVSKLKGSQSTLVKMLHCWKSQVAAQLSLLWVTEEKIASCFAYFALA